MADDDIAVLVSDLDRMAAEVRRNLRPALRKAAEPVRADAARRASWSTRIPDAISVRPTFAQGGLGVVVRVSAAQAPHARAYEHGGRPGTFGHPVYADQTKSRREWTWVRQRARPFFWPAVQANQDRVVQAVADATDEAARRHGFH